jgi:hypothetical protein
LAADRVGTIQEAKASTEGASERSTCHAWGAMPGRVPKKDNAAFGLAAHTFGAIVLLE